MSTQSAWQLCFDFGDSSPVVVEPSAAQISSDAGLLPFRELDEHLGLTRHCDSDVRSTPPETSQDAAAGTRTGCRDRMLVWPLQCPRGTEAEIQVDLHCQARDHRSRLDEVLALSVKPITMRLASPAFYNASGRNKTASSNCRLSPVGTLPPRVKMISCRRRREVAHQFENHPCALARALNLRIQGSSTSFQISPSRPSHSTW
jgi:hypothetical protein